jgi:hemolysin activation/secretion protein
MVLPFAANAATDAENAARIQNQIMQQQEQSRRADIERREIIDANKLRKTRTESDDTLPSVQGSDKNTNCPTFGKITIYGADVYSENRLEKLTNKYIGLCVNRDNMAAIQSELTNLYIGNKYTLARIYFDSSRSTLSRGENDVAFVVEEGRVNKVIMQDRYNGEYSAPESWFARTRNKMKTFTIAPFASDDTFYMKDFEQALDQVNRLQSSNATMDIKPTPGLNAAGLSDIYILNNHDSWRTTFISAGLDNSGSKNTGKNIWNFSINQDNLLALNDNIYFKYSADTDYKRDHHYSDSLFGSISIPLGYWTINASTAWSAYLTTVDGMYVSFKTHGKTFTQSLGLERVLYRSANYRTNLAATLNWKDTDNWIRDMKSLTGSRVSSSINLSWNNTIYHPLGTIIVKPGYQQGLGGILNAKKDAGDIMRTEPHLEYNMAKLYLYSGMRFNLGLPISWNTTFDGQYSFQNLYGTDQVSLGGEYSIRGFKDSSISGDIGFSLRNEIKLPVWNMLPDFLTDFGMFTRVVKPLQIGGFYDFGYVRNRTKITPDPYDSNSGNMSGIGGGVYYSGTYLDMSLTYSQSLQSPRYLQTRDAQPKEERAIYWRISAKY